MLYDICGNKLVQFTNNSIHIYFMWNLVYVSCGRSTLRTTTIVGKMLMEITIIIIGTFAFILGYRYINYLREYMNIRFGIKEKK